MEESTPSDEIRGVAREDPSVPPALAAVWPDAIPALYLRGVWPVDSRSMAIVGTTKPSPEARKWSFELAREAALRGWTVVSGLALGIDGAAHEGALAGGGKTVAVVADGLDAIYPAQHRNLAQRIVETGGTIVSISPPGVRGGHAGLLLRNKMTSALCCVAVSGQSRGRDGALATMHHAARQGRQLAAIVPPLESNSEAWQGNTMLLSNKPPWQGLPKQWFPAISVIPGSDLDHFFVLLEYPLDEPSHLRETPETMQPRLLESASQYGD